MFAKSHISVLVQRCILFLALITGLFGLQPAQTVQAAGNWYVATTGSDTNLCSTPDLPCLTINKAIEKATEGDTIKVAIGIYAGSGENVVTIQKTLTISGGWNDTFTIQNGYSTVDGQNARRGFIMYGWTSSTIDLFIIENGYAAGISPDGAGVNASDLFTINNSIIRNNYASGDGGGIHG